MHKEIEPIADSVVHFETITNSENPDGSVVIYFPELTRKLIPENLIQITQESAVRALVMPIVKYGEEEIVYLEAVRDYLSSLVDSAYKVTIVGSSSGSIMALAAARFLGIPSENVVLIAPAVVPLPSSLDKRLLDRFPDITDGGKASKVITGVNAILEKLDAVPFARNLIQRLFVEGTDLYTSSEITRQQALENTYKYWISPSRFNQLLVEVNPVVMVGSNDRISQFSLRNKSVQPIIVNNAQHNLEGYIAELIDYLDTRVIN